MTFSEYLDNSQDATTLILECSESVGYLKGSIDCYIKGQITTDKMHESIYKVIRNVWDVAYSHGFFDAESEN